uniref:hypothetical protein n=1 Tax=Flavobacterium sp. TaxID=239 RepID=UPI00404A0BFB
MEPYKNIKDKLNAREIQPSANSWDRLDAMLSLEEKPKKKVFPFYYVAASILFALGLTFWFTNQSSEIIIPENNGIVIRNENVSPEINEVKNSILNQVSEENKDAVLVENKKETNFQETIVQSRVVKKQNLIQTNKSIAINSSLNNNTKVLESLITDNEVEKEVEAIQVLKKKPFKIKIDANSLLSAAENEMDNEYKETNLDKLSRNFKEVKSALANRNYE